MQYNYCLEKLDDAVDLPPSGNGQDPPNRARPVQACAKTRLVFQIKDDRRLSVRASECL